MFYLDINIPSTHGYICQTKNFTQNYTSSLHWHGFIEMEFVIDGTGVHHFGDTEYRFKKGDAWILTTQDSHRVFCEQGLRIVNISLDPEVLQPDIISYLSMNHPLHCAFDEEEQLSFLKKIDSLHSEQTTQQLLSHTKAISLIQEMIVEIARKSDKNIATIQMGIVQDMINYIHTNYKNDISLKQLAHKFSFTPNYCGHLLKKEIGVTYNEYITNLRLRNACKLLLNSNISIKKIALDSGFHSIEYFYTSFKKFYGITPARYRSIAISQKIASL